MGFFRKFFDPFGIVHGGRNDPFRRRTQPHPLLQPNTISPEDAVAATPTVPTTGPAGDARNDAAFSRNAPRIVTENGQTYLTEHGNRRLLQGDEIASGTAYADDFWSKFPTGFQPGVGPQTNAEYDVRPATGGTTGTGGSGAGGSNVGTGTGWNGLNLTMGDRRQQAPFSGFNEGRAASGGDPDSVKDAFYRWVMSLDFDPRGKSKDEIDDYLTSQIDSAKTYGIDISDVEGEKILVNTKERGPEWVDTIRAAGATSPEDLAAVAWQWGAGEGAGDLGPGGGPSGGGNTGGLNTSALDALLRLPGGQALADALRGGADDKTLAEIIAELNRVLTGQAPTTPNMPIPTGGSPSYGGGDGGPPMVI